MSVKALLLHQLEESHEVENWIHPLAVAVAGLNAAQASWKPSPERHSIWQILRHVIHWKQPLLDRWEGKAVPTSEELSAADWREASGGEAAWQADVQRAQRLYDAIRQRVDAISDDALMSTPPGGTRPLALSLSDLATHDAYHAGQIRHLRALQGI
jgi:uncharacterized damage-inducible protein DinB